MITVNVEQPLNEDGFFFDPVQANQESDHNALMALADEQNSTGLLVEAA